MAGLGAVVAKGVSAASNLGEQLNKVDVVFGKSADAITDWSRTTANAFGLSQRAALEAAGGFGQILETAGLNQKQAGAFSKQLVELGADIASFNNIDPSEALDKLRSGLVGEAEPLRRVGVLLSEARVKQEAYDSGLAKTGDTLTEQQKVQARFNLILKDTATAQGDFARTSDSFANAQRRVRAQLENAAASIGGAVLPAVAKAASALSDFISDFSAARTVRAKFDIVASGLENLGRDLFAQAKQAIDSVDWNAAAASAQEGIFNALRRLGDVVGQIDWGQVGRNVGRFISDAFKQTAAFLNSVDWGNVGRVIVRGIGNFLKGVNWKAVAVATVKLLAAALKATTALLLGIGKELGGAIMDGVGRGLDAAKDFVLRKLLAFVNRVLGVTSFLGRFDPFKGVRERTQKQLDAMTDDARGAAKSIQAALDGIKNRKVTVTIESVMKATQAVTGQPARPGAEGDAASAITGAIDDALGAAKKLANAAISKGREAVSLQAKATGAAKSAADKVTDGAEKQREAFQNLIAALQLKVDQAGARRGFTDDLRANTALQDAIKKQIQTEGKTPALLQDLFQARQARQEIVGKINEQAREASQARQFRALGLSATGDDLVPTVANLKKQLGSLSQRIVGTGLDTSKTAAMFARVAKVLAGGFGKVTEETREKIRDMWAEIRGELDKESGKPIASKALNVDAVLSGLGLDNATLKELQSRLSRLGANGRQLGGGGQVGAFGMALPVTARAGGETVVHTHVNLDGREIASSTERILQRKGGRNSTVATGPFSGRRSGL